MQTLRTAAALAMLFQLGCSHDAVSADGTVRSVAIDSTATLHLPPDRAAVTLTFGAIEDDLGVAHTAVEAHRTRFLAQAEGEGRRIETGAIAYAPYRPNGAALDRFRATQTVVVRTSDFASIPAIIGSAGDGLTSVNVGYYVEDMTQHRSRLRQMAIDAAGVKAGELAEGFGASLGEVLTIEERGAGSRSFGVGQIDNAFARVETSDDEEPPPGAIPLRVTLRVSYVLEG